MWKLFFSFLVALNLGFGLGDAVDAAGPIGDSGRGQANERVAAEGDEYEDAQSSIKDEGSVGSSIRGVKRAASEQTTSITQATPFSTVLEMFKRALAEKQAPDNDGRTLKVKVEKEKEKKKRRPKSSAMTWTNAKPDEDNGLDPPTTTTTTTKKTTTTTTTTEGEWSTFVRTSWPSVSPSGSRFGNKVMDCNGGGASNQALYIGNIKMGSCNDFHPCTCGLKAIDMAMRCPNLCRPYCSRKACATPALCRSGFNYVYYNNGTKRKIPEKSLQGARTTSSWNWYDNFGYPACQNTPGTKFGGFNPYG